MKKIILFSFLLLSYSLYSQKETLLKPGRIIFYNVENLFDTINDPVTQDEEFLPESRNNWDTKKYQVKLDHISKAIAALLDTIQPMLIGLSEVENQKVVEDLIGQPSLKKFELGIIHHDSPDERGIDVAILYNKEALKVAFDATLKIEFPFDKDDRTRDILYVKSYVNEGEPVWFFVNHWPSRKGGKESTEEKRKYVAQVLKNKIENIYLGEHFARVVLIGDFNDNPDDPSLNILCSALNNSKSEPMIDLMKPLQAKGEFSLKYKSEGDIFDQIIVSKNLLDNRNPFFIRNSEAHIFSPDFLLFHHPKEGLIPNRTYAQGRWTGGYSDHLPVYFDLIFK